MLLYKLFHWIKPFFERVFDSMAPILGPIKQRLENFYNTTIGWIILAPLYLVFRFVVWAVVVFLLPAAILCGPINLVYRTFGIAFGDRGSWVIAVLTILLIYGLPILSAVLYSREQEDREKERGWYRRELAEMQEGLRAKLRVLEDERQEQTAQTERDIRAACERGEKEGLTQGREEGYSLGHSEGYKYALYAQNRFRYYNDDPPLTYEEARRSLDEGTDGANGELIEPPKKPRTRKKKAEPELTE